MSKPIAIPEKHHRSVLHWWMNGKSTREIAQRLRDKGVQVSSHATVWNLLDRIAEGRSHVAGAAATARLRVQSTKALSTMETVQNRIVAASRKDATKEDIALAKEQLPLLKEAHRMAAVQLKMSGVTSGKFNGTINTYAEATAQLADLTNAKDGISWPFTIPDEVGTFNNDPRNPFKECEFDLNTLGDIARLLKEHDEAAANSEPETEPSMPPVTGRNAQCPCGSGKKVKRCHPRSAESPPASTQAA